MRKRAFTLIEMVVVVGIIFIIIGLLIPAISKSTAKAQGVLCLGNLRQIGFSLQLFVTDNENRMPTMYDKLVETNVVSLSVPTVDIILKPYLKMDKILQCPSDVNYYLATDSSYSWNSSLNGQNADKLESFLVTDHTLIPVFFDKEGFHRARGSEQKINWLYADGHVKKLFELSRSK